ncbi:MAG TPA: nucleotidyltransferase [Clostridiaceae bacterium]|nr:nucleotidyltransferase [Clostridiaceae bacterium]
MSKQPILVILAAGMGSRYGGLKQIEPIGPGGEIIMDYSLYDAYQAGFRRVVFIIKKEIEQEFDKIIGKRIAKHYSVQYAFQDINDLPDGYNNPEERVKPWGTSHALLAARDIIDAPFCVINADDYYGREAFQIVYDFLVDISEKPAGSKPQYLMVGYQLMKTLSKYGHVARGICEVDLNNKLIHIVERTKIVERDNQAFMTEDDGQTWEELPRESTVSMNFWGFDLSLIDYLKAQFPTFLDQALTENPLKAEFLLPSSIAELIANDTVEVSVKTSHDQWHGVTYKEDKPQVEQEIQKLIDSGVYSSPLWEA